jgi:exopolysaccharide biosynthesis predicted pyruvyltransferase EpsI
VEQSGNVGDALISAGAGQLFSHYGIQTISPDDPNPAPAEWLVISGGGNMGNLYADCVAQREKLYHLARTQRLQVLILPQSFNAPDAVPKHARVFVREEYSRRHCPWAVLAPDLALGFACTWTPPAPRHREGIWLRRDTEAVAYDLPSLGDPVAAAKTPREYIDLAAGYEHIITDRLHFAIAGLLAGRHVTLLANSYPKNRGVYEAWLKGLGCQWRDPPTIASAPPAKPTLVHRWRALARRISRAAVRRLR